MVKLERVEHQSRYLPVLEHNLNVIIVKQVSLRGGAECGRSLAQMGGVLQHS